VIIKNPTPPDNVAAAYNDTAAAAQRIITAQNEAEAKVKAAEGERDAQNTRAAAEALTAEQLEYLKVQAMQTCAANSNCTLIVTDGTSGVNVNTGGGSGG
jgi:regulator of protease activity HflC (stomatin/prohibitin superfamily)